MEKAVHRDLRMHVRLVFLRSMHMKCMLRRRRAFRKSWEWLSFYFLDENAFLLIFLRLTNKVSLFAILYRVFEFEGLEKDV